MTVAVIESPGKITAVGVALCCPKDRPSRRLGRTIAVGRALRLAGR
jgi:hypothetical protein